MQARKDCQCSIILVPYPTIKHKTVIIQGKIRSRTDERESEAHNAVC